MKTFFIRFMLVTVAVGAIPTGPHNPATVTKAGCTLVALHDLHHGHRAAPRIHIREGTSSNWSGYAVETLLASPQKSAVSNVEGGWTIPTLSPSASPHTYSAFWVGIDGDSDNTVEQIGTEQDWTPSGQQNYVWFEMYPHANYLISGFPISPGDKFGAGVKYLGGGIFGLSITNFTQGVAYTVPTHYTKIKSAQRSSAEWVAEAPYSGGVLPLADFGKAFFSGCVATLDGITGPIDNAPSWQNDPITMEDSNGTVKAQPSAVKDTGGNVAASSAFSVQWFHE